MLSIVCWKYGTKYGPDYVNKLASMVRRHLHVDHRIICITDDPTGLDIASLPIRYTAGQLNLRRLWLFSEEAHELFGPRVLQLDLDIVITGDITPLVDRTDPFVIWRYTAPNSLGYALNTTFMLMDTGMFNLWNDYLDNPTMMFNAAKAARCSGSDQSIVTYYFTHIMSSPTSPKKRVPTCPVYTEDDGIYWYKELQRRKGVLPENARVVSFHGASDPSKHVDQWSWVAEHWR